MTPANPPCSYCRGRTNRDGQSKGKQRYRCIACGHKFSCGDYKGLGRRPSSAPPLASCVACNGPMRSAGLDHGVQRIYCRPCNIFCRTYRLHGKKRSYTYHHSTPATVNPWCTIACQTTARVVAGCMTCHGPMKASGTDHAGPRLFCASVQMPRV